MRETMSEMETGRGDYRGYVLSAIIFAVSISLLFSLYHVFDPIFIELWGDRSGCYLDTYRTWGAKIWRMFYRCSSTWFFLWLPILWLLSTGLMQSALKKLNAKVFNKAHITFILILSGLAFICFFGLILMPLGVWSNS